MSRKNILLAVVGTLAVLVLGFVIVVAMQPDDFRVSRSTKMNAPPSAPFAQVNDYHHWDGWSPWAKLDPNAKVTFDGPTSGTGAKFSWSGNDKVGAGQQTIIESKPDELVRIKLDFEKPFKNTCTAEFTFQPEGDQTLVTWSMFGKNDFIGKVFSLFINCDKMVGSEFEKGLASMKAIVEAPPAASEKDEGGKPGPEAVTKAE
jgi:polyketide cyclase/dehydrase/lipid transport protein